MSLKLVSSRRVALLDSSEFGVKADFWGYVRLVVFKLDDGEVGFGFGYTDEVVDVLQGPIENCIDVYEEKYGAFPESEFQVYCYRFPYWE